MSSDSLQVPEFLPCTEENFSTFAHVQHYNKILPRGQLENVIRILHRAQKKRRDVFFKDL